MSDILARLIAAGTPTDLIADVARELARAEVEREAIATRRDSDRKRQSRHRSSVMSRDKRDSAPPIEKVHTPPEDQTGSSEPVCPKARKATFAHTIPADFEPSLTAAAQKLVDGWPPGEFEREVAAFRDHAADKGRRSKDWQAALRTWLNNANKWKPRNDRPGPDQRNGVARALDRRIGGGNSGLAVAADPGPASALPGHRQQPLALVAPMR